jgi:hypothetical protein
MYGRPTIEDHDPAGGTMAMAAKVEGDMPASYRSMTAMARRRHGDVIMRTTRARGEWEALVRSRTMAHSIAMAVGDTSGTQARWSRQRRKDTITKTARTKDTMVRSGAGDYDLDEAK